MVRIQLRNGWHSKNNRFWRSAYEEKTALNKKHLAWGSGEPFFFYAIESICQS